jgi:tight adherence protein B
MEKCLGLTALVFLTVFLGVAAGWQLLAGFLSPDASRIRRRIAEEFGKDETASTSPLFKDLNRLSLEPQAESFDARPETAPPVPRGDIYSRLARMLEQANLSWKPRQLFIIAGVSSFILGVAVTVFGGLLLGLLASFAGAAAPLVFVQVRRKRRRDKYLKQLPNAFELMSRVIRAGQSVPQALQAVADAFEDPLAGEFADCQKQQNLGLRPEVTFQEMAERSGILEMRIFAMAMLIQRQTGGNLSDVLERLAGLIRARIKLKQHVRTLTAEGRMQGVTLIVLPFAALAVMMAVNRPYVEILFQHVPVLAGMLGIMVIGILWIRKIVNIEG